MLTQNEHDILTRLLNGPSIDATEANAILRHLLETQINITRSLAEENTILRARLRDIEQAWRGNGPRETKIRTKQHEEQEEQARIARRTEAPHVRKR